VYQKASSFTRAIYTTTEAVNRQADHKAFQKFLNGQKCYLAGQQAHSIMSGRVEILSRIFEKSQTDQANFSILEDGESDNDSSGQELGSEGSDADISTHPAVVDSGNEKKRLQIRHHQNCFNDECQTPNDSEIIFLKLKLKLLVKESNEEYRKVRV
jgi:hypothetical protein